MLNKLKKAKNGVYNFYTKRSTLAFILTLIVLFALIALSHFLRTPEPEPVKPAREVKKTRVYSETSPVYYQSLSEVRKEGVTTVVALTPGIVTSINVKPGNQVQGGTVLLTLTNDYKSGSAGLATAIAKNNLELAQELDRLSDKIETDEERIVETDDTLSNRQERVALQELKKDRETREFNLLNSELNYRLQAVSDAALRPKALQAGVVQRIAVKNGDYVTPGQVLATISHPAGQTIIESSVASEVAPFIDITKEAKITLADGTVIKTVPTYFSASEDQDGMFAIEFAIDDVTAQKITVNETPTVELPLRFMNEATILVPLDAVFKNTDSAVVLVAVDGKAEARTVTLGRVRGNYIEVLQGLQKNEPLILNRFVLAGDPVEVVTE